MVSCVWEYTIFISKFTTWTNRLGNKVHQNGSKAIITSHTLISQRPLTAQTTSVPPARFCKTCSVMLSEFFYNSIVLGYRKIDFCSYVITMKEGFSRGSGLVLKVEVNAVTN